MGENTFGDEKHITTTCEPRNHMPVIKADGRTSGYRHGHINGTVGDIWMKNHWHPEHGRQVTREWLVLSSEGKTHAVSAGGDSGSVFVAKDEDEQTGGYAVAGQMFGGGIRQEGSEYEGYSVTFLTPIRAILEHLGKAVGEELVVLDRLVNEEE